MFWKQCELRRRRRRRGSRRVKLVKHNQ